MAASIPWSEIVWALWTVIVAVVAYKVGRAIARLQSSPRPGFYDYTAKVSKAGKVAMEKAAQQEYDDPWSAALRGDGEKENTV